METLHFISNGEDPIPIFTLIMMKSMNVEHTTDRLHVTYPKKKKKNPNSDKKEI